MHYMFLLIGEEPSWEDVSPEEMQKTLDEMEKYNDELKAAGAMIGGHGLRERATASVVRFSEGGETTVTDGPFAETKESFFSYIVIDVADFDAALGWAKRMPNASYGSVEVRPLSIHEQDT